MMDFLSAHASVLGGVAAALLGGAFIALVTARWEAIALWFQSFWDSVPLIGGIAWLARREKSRQMSERMHTDKSAVLALCASYARFIRVLNRSDYDNYMNYLRKAGDLGKQPFPPYLRVVIFVMVLVEAAGFAYVLAGWTLPGASEFTQRIAAGGIGLLIAVILVFFTHWAGLEIDHATRYRRDRREWIAAGRNGPLYGPDLSLNDAQNVDDLEPAFRQRATRGHGKKSYVLTTVTLLMVIAVGSGAAYVRGQVLEQELVLDSATRVKSLQRFDLNMPEAGSADLSSADQGTIQEELQIKRRGGWGTLIILAVIFFFLQVLGIFFGYRYSFYGRLSKDAYRALQADRFSSYNELLQYYDRIADIAQSKVERLQQLIEQRQRGGLGGSLHSHHDSFRDYLQAREAQRREQPLGGDPESLLPEVIVDPAVVARTAHAAPAPAQVLAAHAAPAPAQVLAPTAVPSAAVPLATPASASSLAPTAAHSAAAATPPLETGAVLGAPPGLLEDDGARRDSEGNGGTLTPAGQMVERQVKLEQRRAEQRAAQRAARNAGIAFGKGAAPTKSEVN